MTAISDLRQEALRRGKPRRPVVWVLLGCLVLGALVGWWLGAR